MNDLPAAPGIYRISFTGCDDCYVGSTGNVAERCRAHIGSLRRGHHENKRMQATYQQHGHASLSVSLLEECALKHLHTRERHWIKVLKPTINKATVPKRLSERGMERQCAERKKMFSFKLRPSLVAQLKQIAVTQPVPVSLIAVIETMLERSVREFLERREQQPKSGKR
jgi:group I intron endonuclease